MKISKPILLGVGLNKTIEKNINRSFKLIFDCFFSTTHMAGLELLKIYPYSTKLIFVSTQLEGDSVAYIEQLKQQNAFPEIIVLSASEDPQMIIKFMEKGAADVLTHVDIDIIKNSVKNIMPKITLFDKIRLSGKNVSDVFNTQLSALKEYFKIQHLKGTPLTTEELLTFFSNEYTAESENTFIKCLDKTFKLTLPEKKNTLLIIEDDEQLNHSLTRILKRKYTVHSVYDGESALKKLHIADIDVVLLDIGLPRMLGTELIPKIKKSLPDTEIIMLTAYDDIEKIRASFQSGAFDYIIKPYKLESLFFKISTAIQKTNIQKILLDFKDLLLLSQSNIATKTWILEGIFKSRLTEKKPLLMQDIYALFPHLKKCMIPSTDTVPSATIENGIFGLVESLSILSRNRS